MKKIFLSVAAGVMVAGGVTVATALPASASAVSCTSQSHSTSNGGNAKASGCSHTGTNGVRLKAECRLSPFNTFSPTVTGKFSSKSFTTGACQFGVNKSGFEHV